MSSDQSAAPKPPVSNAAGGLTAQHNQARHRRWLSSVTDFRTEVAAVVAILAVMGFAFTVWYLLVSAHSSSDAGWQRLAYVFSGVETVVFTAVGWLFGREINRKQAETAQQRADTATAGETAALRQVADLSARGKAAKEAVAARQATYSDSTRIGAHGITGSAANAASSDMDELASLMNALFPD
jgi:hypothetical protein